MIVSSFYGFQASLREEKKFDQHNLANLGALKSENKLYRVKEVLKYFHLSGYTRGFNNRFRNKYSRKYCSKAIISVKAQRIGLPINCG